MKIERIETIPVRIPIRPFASALTKFGPISSMSCILVRVTTDSGLIGIGESPPEPLFFGETLESCESAMLGYLGPAIYHLDVTNIELILRRMDWALVGNPCAKQAIDLAIFDLLGKEMHLGVHQLIGGKIRKQVQIGWELGSGETKVIVDEALNYISRGITTLKLKVGVLDIEKEVEIVHSLRKAVGDDIQIRIDANQSWTPTQSIKAINRLSKDNLEFVEQPVPREDLDGLARVRDAVELPVEADESVFSPRDAINVVRRKAADMVNIKIPKAGGIWRSKQIAAISEAADMPCRLGSNLDMGIGVAAKLHLACSTPNMTYASEFTELGVLLDDIVDYEYRISNSSLDVPTGYGLGVDLLDEKVKKYRIDTSGMFHKHTYPS